MDNTSMHLRAMVAVCYYALDIALPKKINARHNSEVKGEI